MSYFGNDTTGTNLGRLLGYSLSYSDTIPPVVTAELIVTKQHLQPAQLVHGGVYATLAEECGSFGAGVTLAARSPNAKSVVGTNLQCSHVGSAVVGDRITAEAHAIHIGRSTQIWDILIEKINQTSQKKSKVSLCRLTVMNMYKQQHDEDKHNNNNNNNNNNTTAKDENNVTKKQDKTAVKTTGKTSTIQQQKTSKL